MAAKFSRPAAKSHARNLAFQAIGGGTFLSSRDFWPSFIALVIKLPCDLAWERCHRKIARPPTTANKATPPAQIPLRPIPELSDGGAAAFVGVSGSAVISGWVGMALVCTNGATAGGFTSLATAGAGADVAAMGTGTTAFGDFSGATAGGFTSLATAGAGADVATIGGGTATSLVFGVLVAALVCVSVLVSWAGAVIIPAARTMVQM
jgi:hypothetical protein